MDKIFRNLTKSASKRQEEKEIMGNRIMKNSQTILIKYVEKKLRNWNIPKMDKWDGL